MPSSQQPLPTTTRLALVLPAALLAVAVVLLRGAMPAPGGGEEVCGSGRAMASTTAPAVCRP